MFVREANAMHAAPLLVATQMCSEMHVRTIQGSPIRLYRPRSHVLYLLNPPISAQWNNNWRDTSCQIPNTHTYSPLTVFRRFLPHFPSSRSVALGSYSCSSNGAAMGEYSQNVTYNGDRYNAIGERLIYVW